MTPKPPGARNIVSIARAHARLTPERTAYVFLGDGETEQDRRDFGRVDLRARAIAAALQQRGLAGERVLIALPCGLAYIEAFLGCLYAGAVAVPADTPAAQSSQSRLAAIRADCAPALVLTDTDHAHPELSGLPRLDPVCVPDETAVQWTAVVPAPGETAFLQYTSGSTRTPRGVMVSHGNIVANERLIAAACTHDRDSVFVGWQPLFHDMGLIANILQPLYLGSMSVLMPPAAFLRRPMRWLKAVSKYRAHTSGGPNFAYDLCTDRAKRLGEDGQDALADLDLSCWRVAFNSAEPVRESTMRRFTAAFSRYGFSDAAHFPCFGLAEATLLVTAPAKAEPPSVRRVDTARLRNGYAVPPRHQDPDLSTMLVGCGPAGLETKIAIVDPVSARERESGEVGEIWVSGGGVALGYWGGDTEGVFDARLPVRQHQSNRRRYLRTGDLGCLLDGELYVTGRRKDVIVVQGRNLYPQDLEYDAEHAHPALRPGCAIAFAVAADDGGQRVVVCCELRAYRDETDPAELARTIGSILRWRHGIELSALVVLRRGGVPKTTSGKLRRSRCREEYEAGRLPIYREVRMVESAAPSLPGADELRGLPVARAEAKLAGALVAAAGARHSSTIVGGHDETAVPLAALGLTSLAALGLDHALSREYGRGVGLPALLGSHSAIKLARELLGALESAPTTASASAGAAIAEEDLADPAGWLPVTGGQRALWLEQAQAPESAAYHLARALILEDADPERLIRGLGCVLERYPAFRLRFDLRYGEVRCRVVGDAPKAARLNACAVAEAEFAELLRDQADRPFDLAAEPPVRATLYRRDQNSYVLLLVVHHLIADFWSLVVLLRELAAAYANETEHSVAASLDQSGLVAAERHREGTEAFARDRAYWCERLAGAPALLDLPTDRPAPGMRELAGSTASFELPWELTTRLRALAAARGQTLFSLLLAAYQVLMHRLSGQDDIVIGTLLSGREDPRASDTVGYLVNLVPMRSAYRRTGTFEGFAERTARELLGALEHGAVPYGRIVADLGPERVTGHAPLVQSLFTMHAEPGGRDDGISALALGLPGHLLTGSLRIKYLPIDRAWAQFDLALAMAEIGGRLTGVWEYRTGLFDAASVDAFTEAFRRLLEAATDDPSRALDELAVADRPEPQEQTKTATGPARPDTGLHLLVAAAACRRPDAVAVTAPGSDGSAEQLSYRALHVAAARLAGRLRETGIRADEPVAVAAERGVEMVIGYLGVLYAGAAVFPVDPGDPDIRLRDMLADSASRVVVAPAAAADRPGGWPVPVLTILGPPDRPGVIAQVHSSQAAYLLYTSGSSGRPKGVVVPHEAIVNRVLWMQEAYRLAAEERVLHKAPAAFDVSMWELFWPLTAGGCLVVAEPGRHQDPRRLLDLCARERVSIVHFVPTMLAPVLAEAVRGGHAAALRRVVCSGEALDGGLAAAAAEALDAEVHNLYGPTEAAVDVTAWDCGDVIPAGRVPIGRPITHVRCRVLDRRGRELPDRVRGELRLGGLCVARGYLNQPSLTASRFAPIPDGGPGERYYRTGDLVRRLEGDVLDFLYRADDQVKIGGMRVEPGEAAAALRAQPGILDAAVVARAVDGRNVLVAYVVPHGTRTPGTRELREALKRGLPAHLVPSAFVSLERLPLTSSGKLDRRALPEPAALSSSAPGAPAPDTASGALLSLWRRHLDPALAGIDDDFFALGGDSLLAIRLIGDARDLGLPITVTDLLRYRSIRALAEIAGSRAAEPESRHPQPFELWPPAAGRPGIVDAYPLSGGQCALLYQQATNPGYEVYLTSVVVPRVLDQPALQAAADAAMRRHAYLRSSFDLTSYREPVQLIHADLPAPVEFVDLSALPASEADTSADRWLTAERRRAFEPTAGPPVRFAAHDLGDGFRLTISSFALDGWCDATVITELVEDYIARTTGKSAPIAPPHSQFRDFVAEELAATRSAEHLAFWRQELLGLAPGTLAGKGDTRQRGASPNTLTTRHAVIPPVGTAQILTEIAAALGVGLKHMLFAVHLRVLRELLGRAEVVTGLQFNGRPERPGGDRVVGMFNNILPIAVRIPDANWAALARAAAHAELRVAPYRRLPLLELQRRFGAAELFDTGFVFTHFHAYRQLADLGVSGLVAPDQTYLPLTTHANIDAWTGELRLALDYDPHRFGPGPIAEIGERYAGALAELTDPAGRGSAVRDGAAETASPPAETQYPARLLQRLAALTEDETRNLLGTAGRTARMRARGGNGYR